MLLYVEDSKRGYTWPSSPRLVSESTKFGKSSKFKSIVSQGMVTGRFFRFENADERFDEVFWGKFSWT